MHILQLPLGEHQTIRGDRVRDPWAKTAKPNIGLWVALMDNSIMGTTPQEIFMALNCPALSYTGLHYTASKVGPQIVNMVREDLQRERAHLKDVLKSHGFPRQTPIQVEGDGR